MIHPNLCGKIQTVLGLIEPKDLGICLPHEHTVVDGSCWFKEPEEAVASGMRGRGALRVGGVPVGAQAATPASRSSGAGAVMAAEQARARRDVSTAFDLDEADKKGLAGRAGGPNARHVAGRLFIEIDGLWTDMAHSDSLEIMEIEQFSEAYFRVLDRLPELEHYVKEFGQVLVAGKEMSIRIGDEGEELVVTLHLLKSLEVQLKIHSTHLILDDIEPYKLEGITKVHLHRVLNRGIRLPNKAEEIIGKATIYLSSL